MNLTRYLSAAVVAAFLMGVAAGYGLSMTKPPAEAATFSLVSLNR